MSKRVGQKQAARVVRDQISKEKRRRRTVWTSVIAVAALVLAGLIGWGIYASQKAGSYNTPRHASGGATGVSTGSGHVPVDVYLDFMCPHCKAFDEEANAALKQLVKDKKITLAYHPVAFLDSASTTKYSTRASASFACAADGDKAFEYASALFARQPAEGGPGLSDDDLIQVGGTVGLLNPTFARCIRSGTYTSWAAHVTDAASGRGVTGTPTVYVNGKKTEATSEAIINAVKAASQ
ncbi:MAG TPA: thioredoxin domain-containing protein [Micromonosporaceae bacterium]|nr:thioredoxin domain-containing protein [Micromonosporaceae bacterium]